MRKSIYLICSAFAVINTYFLSTLAQATNIGADVQKREAIKEAFNYNYENYMKYAYPADCIDLKELKGAVDGATVGFGGTPIEAMSTMILMNMTDTPYFRDAVKVVQNQTFFTTNESYVDGVPGTVKLYELTVRLIGGMLSAYQMNGEKPEQAFFINKTRTLADRIKGSWVNGAKVPVSIWNMKNQSAYDINAETNCAEAGSITMEWSMLSQYTKDPQYRNLVEGSVNTVRSLHQVFPGLTYTKFHPTNLTSNSKYVTLGARTDGYIAYLLKYPLMLGQPDHPYIETWKQAADSIKNHLTFKSGVNNFTFGGDYDADRNTSVRLFSHWACFLGANMAMGGRLFNRDDWTTLGLEFTESCAATYDETLLGLGPYAFGYADQHGNFTGWKFVSKQQREFYNKHGIFITIAYWFTEYDIVEGLFYAWRVTGMQLWRDLAWKIFLRIKSVADTGHGFAIVDNVNDPSTAIEGPQPPFVYSALLKYLYLIFDERDHYSLDEIVFSKEAMPFKRVHNNKLGKVQGNFKYSPIFYGKNHSASSVALESSNVVTSGGTSGMASLNEGVRPQGLYDAKIGAGKAEYARQLSSYTGMPEDLALDYLGAFNK